MSNERMELMLRIQALEFAAVDLNLYLDTHPTDERALLDYAEIASQLKEEKRMFEATYGPLLNFGHSPSGCHRWQWLNEPWPWETLD